MHKKPKSLTMKILDTIKSIIVRANDTTDFNSTRLRALEDRLAKIDGGPDAEEARVAAFEIVNEKRRGTGTAPLGFKIT